MFQLLYQLRYTKCEDKAGNKEISLPVYCYPDPFFRPFNFRKSSQQERMRV